MPHRKGTVDLDEVNLRILSILRSDCKKSSEMIAKEVGIHRNTANSRISSLEESGVIRGYATNIRQEKLGHPIGAMIMVDFQGHGMEETSIADILEIPELEGSGLVTGNYPFMSFIRVRDMLRLKEILRQIGKNPFVNDIIYDIAIKTHKSGLDFNPIESDGFRPRKDIDKDFRRNDADNPILKDIELDAKKPLTKVAADLKLPLSTVKTRIKKMEESGVIGGYGAIIDFTRLGFKEVSLIRIQVEPEFKKSEEDIITRLLSFRELMNLTSFTGSFDLMAMMMFKDKVHMMEVLRKINHIKGLRHVEVNISYLQLHGRHIRK